MELAENVIVATKFRLVKLVGRGGMGSVWKAIHTELDSPCAVKFIEGEMANNPEMRERFAREAKAAALLRSPHVVQIIDHGVWDERPYIAMELLDGEDLGHRLERVGRLTPAACIGILSQVARALMKAHSAGVVHRDLKPDNIYLVHDDDREVVKILDFGIAKVGLGNASSNTRTGSLLGTPFYMSPEQARGAKSVDHRSDLWSLAIIVFECLTGKRPFEAEGLGELLMMIMASPIPLLRSYNPELPVEAEAWWAKATSRDPNDRYQSAREMVDALSVALGVQPESVVLTRGSFPDLAPFNTATAASLPTSSSNSATLAATATVRSMQDGKSRSKGPLIAIGVGVGALTLAGVLVFFGIGKQPTSSSSLHPASSSPVTAPPSATTSAPPVLPQASETLSAPVPTASNPTEAPLVLHPTATGKAPAGGKTAPPSGKVTTKPEPKATPTTHTGDSGYNPGF